MNSKTLNDSIKRIDEINIKLNKEKSNISNSLNKININTIENESLQEMSNKIKSESKSTINKLIPGKEFNEKIKTFDLRKIDNIVATKVDNLEEDKKLHTDYITVDTLNKNIIFYLYNRNGCIVYDTDEIYLNEDASYMFSDLYISGTIAIASVNSNYTTNMSHMFYAFSGVEIHQSLNAINTTDMSYMFSCCRQLKYIGNLYNTKNVKDMSYMFEGLNFERTFEDPNPLEFESLFTKSLDTSSVTNMEGMFKDCPNVSHLYLLNFDTSNVTNMSHMFDGTCSIDGSTVLPNVHNLINFNTSNVTNMSFMFANMTGTANDNFKSFGTIDTSNVENFEGMFYNYGGYNLFGFNATSMDTRKGKNMTSMFENMGTTEFEYGVKVGPNFVYPEGTDLGRIIHKQV